MHTGYRTYGTGSIGVKVFRVGTDNRPRSIQGWRLGYMLRLRHGEDCTAARVAWLSLAVTVLDTYKAKR